MIVDVYNEIFTALKVDKGLNVEQEFPEGKTTLPVVVLTEVDNTNDLEHRDSGGDQYSHVYFEVQIFTTGSKKRSEAIAIRAEVDDLMSDTYKMHRSFSDEVPNFINRGIYRYVLRYECKIDANDVIYRR